MSTVVVQVGQCGNQIGQAFWNLSKDTEDLKPIYSHWDDYRRSVHIDSEPKVVKHLLDKDSSVRPKNVILSKKGRGTNWALGYHGVGNAQDDQITEQSIDAIRKEVERCSSFSGFLLLHSMSGGTGSGLGSRLCELLKDDYGMPYVLSAVVAPYKSGESPIQYYNSLLCLSTLQSSADGIILLPNDEILDQVQRKVHGKGFNDMNAYIAACLAGMMLPTDTLAAKCGTGIGLEPWDMIRALCPNPATKFVHLTHLGKSKLSWDNLAGQMLQRVSRRNHKGAVYQSCGNLVVARGDTTHSFGAYQQHIEAKVKSIYSCVDWNPFPVEFWTSTKSLGGVKKPASITCAANSTVCVDTLEEVLDRAWQKFHAKAYLHHYYKYGCQEGDFEEAFENLQQVITAYEAVVT